MRLRPIRRGKKLKGLSVDGHLSLDSTHTFLRATSSRVIGLNMDGSKRFESVDLPGIVAGTPVTSFDGRYVYVNHNEGGSTGHFTILDVSAGDSTAIEPAKAIEFMHRTSDPNAPFSALGYYHQPERGAYIGGETNMNDIFVWSYDFTTNPNVTEGQKFAFQMPTNETAVPAPIPLDGRGDFFTFNPPILTDQGFSMYWATNGGSHRCWVNTERLNRNNLDRPPRTRIDSLQRDVDNPPTPGRAPATLSSDPAQPTVFGIGAAREI